MFLIQLKDTKPDVLKHGMISFTLLAESFDLSEISPERGSDSADIFKRL